MPNVEERPIMTNAQNPVETASARAWAHLRDRARERKISVDDLFDLAEWKAQDPDVPEGDWFKDFGTFKLCGTGRYPSTVSAGRTNCAGQAVVTVGSQAKHRSLRIPPILANPHI